MAYVIQLAECNFHTQIRTTEMGGVVVRLRAALAEQQQVAAKHAQQVGIRQLLGAFLEVAANLGYWLQMSSNLYLGVLCVSICTLFMDLAQCNNPPSSCRPPTCLFHIFHCVSLCMSTD